MLINSVTENQTRSQPRSVMNPEPENRVRLFAEMYAHTKNECANCRAPYSCCSPEYGEMAARGMLEANEPIPPSTNNPRCQFLSTQGCIIQPYQRPLCTLHTCDVNSLGFKRNDPEWTEKYFEIRERIDLLELAALP